MYYDYNREFSFNVFMSTHTNGYYYVVVYCVTGL